jgi:hypothetical protein
MVCIKRERSVMADDQNMKDTKGIVLANPRKQAMLEEVTKLVGPHLAECIEPLPRAAFALFMFSTDGPEMAYMSNCPRETTLKVLRNLLERITP